METASFSVVSKIEVGRRVAILGAVDSYRMKRGLPLVLTLAKWVIVESTGTLVTLRADDGHATTYVRGDFARLVDAGRVIGR